MAFPSSFAGGWLDTGNALMQQQSQQLRDALAIADQLNQERAQQAAQEQKQYERAWERDPQNPKNLAAKTNEEWRKSSEQRQKLKDEQQAIEDADIKGTAMFDKGHPFSVAYARLKKLDPDLYAEKEREVFENFRMTKRAEHEAQPAPKSRDIAPDLQTILGGMGAFPGMEGIGQAAPMILGAQLQPATPPQPVPPFMQTGAGALAGPFGSAIPPMPEPPMQQPQFGPAPPMMVTPERAPFMEPTMEQALAAQSPAFALNQQKVQSQMRAEQMRAQANLLRAELDKPRAQASLITAQDREKRTALDTKALEMRVGKFANGLDVLLEKNAISRDRLEEAAEFHKIMGSAATRNAATNARNASDRERNTTLRAKEIAIGKKAIDIWGKFDKEAQDYEDDMRKSEDLLAAAEEDLATAQYNRDAAGVKSTASPNDEALSAEYLAQTKYYAAVKQRRDNLANRSKDLWEAAASYRKVANAQFDALQNRGMDPQYSDGKPAGKPKNIRVPPTRKATPMSRVDAIAKDYGLP